jgi:hypothetical protein
MAVRCFVAAPPQAGMPPRRTWASLPGIKTMSTHTVSDVLSTLKKIMHQALQEMKIDLYAMLLVAGSAFGLALQTPELQAADQSIVKLGALQSRVPGDWKEEAPYDPECYKAYRLEPASDDEFDANVAIYFLGKQPDNTAARYVELWKQEFLPPEGTTMAQANRLQAFKVRGAQVTYLDIHGDYKGIPGNPASRRENFRLLGVYLDTPQGAYRITMFGPADTVELYRSEFESWIKAFK